MNPAASTVALTDGTGYSVRRLLPLLEGCGVRLRFLTRRIGGIRAHVSADIQIAQADVLDPAGLSGLVYWHALYLIHEFVYPKPLALAAFKQVAASTASLSRERV